MSNTLIKTFRSVCLSLQIAVIRNGKKVSSLKVNFEPVCAAVHPGQTEVAVGGGVVRTIISLTLGGGGGAGADSQKVWNLKV